MNNTISQKTVVLENEGVQVEWLPGVSSVNHNTIAFSFSPWVRDSQRKGYGAIYAEKFLTIHCGFDVLAFKSSTNSWYQNISDDTIQRINSFIDLKYKNSPFRVAYGSSMGAYGAIQFSQPFKFNRVLAYSPQFDIRVSWDRRWAKEATDISFKYFIDSSTCNKQCNYYIVYDPHDTDGRHADLLKKSLKDRMISIPIPYSGHPASFYLSETGLIKSFASAILSGDSISHFQKDLRKRRILSKSYYLRLSTRLIKSGHLQLGHSMLERALALDPDSAPCWRQKSILLERLGLIEQSHNAVKKAITLAPLDPWSRWHYSGLLSQKGYLEEAIEQINLAIKIEPAPSAFIQRRNHLLLLKAHQCP